MKFKEKFYQPAYLGVRSHWVVFYYKDGNLNNTHEAAYFNSEEECEVFIKEECGGRD